MGDDISFEEWCKQLDAVAKEHGYEGSLVDVTGADAWLEYFNEGDSPADAYSNDLHHA